jgi:hypothetical protein
MTSKEDLLKQVKKMELYEALCIEDCKNVGSLRVWLHHYHRKLDKEFTSALRNGNLIITRVK